MEVGKIYEGKVTGITKFGAFIEIEPGTTGMVHISEISNTYVNEIKDHLTEGQTVKDKVLIIGDDGKISLSIKKAMDNPRPDKKPYRKNNNNNNNNNSRPPRERYEKKKPVVFDPTVPPSDNWEPRRQQDLSFEDMLNKFKQSSEEKQCDLKKIIDNKRKGTSRRGGVKS